MKNVAASLFVVGSGLGVLGLIAACSSDSPPVPQVVTQTVTVTVTVPGPPLPMPTVTTTTTASTTGTVVPPMCVPSVLKSHPGPLFFYFVADGSGSMSCMGPNDSSCKRTAQEQGLRSIFTALKNAKDNSVGAGMIYFGPDGMYPAADDVPIRAVDDAHFLKLMQRVAKFPDGATPTLAALQGAYTVLDRYQGVAPLPKDARKVVVLLSDGQPNEGPDAVYPVVEKYATQSAPIVTFSVGIGGLSQIGYDPKFMAQVAIKGGTARPGCNPNSVTGNFCHFQVTTDGGVTTTEIAMQIDNALSEIRREANACDFAFDLVDPLGKPANPALVTVETIDATTKQVKGKVDRSATDGWSFDSALNPTRIFLSGPACNALKADKSVSIEVKLACPPAGP
jgi:uncharacterized protein YegL